MESYTLVSVTTAFDGCVMTLLQDGKLHLVITHDGQVDREVWFESTHRLNDNRPHRVVVRRNDRYVSIRLTHYRRRRGVVISVFRRMNEVTLRRARLVLGWVTVFGRVYHHGT